MWSEQCAVSSAAVRRRRVLADGWVGRLGQAKQLGLPPHLGGGGICAKEATWVDSAESTLEWWRRSEGGGVVTCHQEIRQADMHCTPPQIQGNPKLMNFLLSQTF